MKTKQSLLPLILLSLLSSCSTHFGTISSSSLGKPIQYVDIAYGTSQTNRYFCIGGISQDALVLEAKRELIKNRPLMQNEEYLNFTMDFKHSYYPFYKQTRVTMSADVIILTNEVTPDVLSMNYLNKLSFSSLANDLFEIGDSIIYKDDIIGTIISFENSKNARIIYNTNKNKIRTRKVSIDNIFTDKKDFRGNKVGERYVFEKRIKGNVEMGSGKIKAFGLNSIRLIENSGALITVDYKD